MFVGKLNVKLRSLHLLKIIYYSDAALMAMRRKILGKSPAEIKLIKREEVDLPVTTDDFKEAISKTRKSVSEADVKNFENWMAEYGSC